MVIFPSWIVFAIVGAVLFIMFKNLQWVYLCTLCYYHAFADKLSRFREKEALSPRPLGPRRRTTGGAGRAHSRSPRRRGRDPESDDDDDGYED
jgi:hypothetical protein